MRHPARRHRRAARARTSRSAPTSSRPTPSAPSPSRSASTASPSGPTSSTSPAARIAREVADGSRRPTGPVRRRLDRARAPSRRRSARSASPSCATPTRCRPAGLLEGGVDLLIIETQFDLLGAKAADHRRPPGHGGRRAARCRSRCRSPWSSPAACCSAPRSAPRSPRSTRCRPDVIGLNCATGPAEMSEHLRHLSPARPHADLVPAQRRPAVGGRRQDALRPHARASWPSTRRRFVTELGVQVVGGCCGTTPEHLAPARRARAATSRRRRRDARPRAGRHVDLLSSCRSTRTPSFLIIGERTNANGSKKFREAMLDGDWDTCVADGHATR